MVFQGIVNNQFELTCTVADDGSFEIPKVYEQELLGMGYDTVQFQQMVRLRTKLLKQGDSALLLGVARLNGFSPPPPRDR